MFAGLGCFQMKGQDVARNGGKLKPCERLRKVAFGEEISQETLSFLSSTVQES